MSNDNKKKPKIRKIMDLIKDSLIIILKRLIEKQKNRKK